jgi:UDP-glucose:(heptosyl)LPS alpha-1,3-glucosyltransferase
MAVSLGLAERVEILQGRDDIPRFLLGADLLIHPAYNENTGTVLLEAVVAGLPVLTTAVCGYAHYIDEAGAGIVLPDPFAQTAMNEALAHMLNDDAVRRAWQANALAFANQADIYDNAEVAADVILKARP